MRRYYKTGAGRDGFDGRDSMLFLEFVGVFEKLACNIEQRAVWITEAAAHGYTVGTIKYASFVLLAEAWPRGMTAQAISEAAAQRG